MGGKQNTSIQTTFFLPADIEILKLKFNDFNQGIHLFDLQGFSEFSVKIHNYLTKHIKSKKDFKSFVGILECFIYGKSTNIELTKSSSLDILIEIIIKSTNFRKYYEIIHFIFSLC